MMFIQNLENFPVVSVSFKEEDIVPVSETIAIYESLLSREMDFVFLSEDSQPPSQPQEKDNHEERKLVAAWVKAHRDLLAKYVKAFIQIEPNEEIRLQTQKFANNFVKFSGYPMFVVDDLAQAQKVIDSVLK